MIVKITSKRQVTFPARVLEALGVAPATNSNWQKVRTASFCGREGSICLCSGWLRDKIPSGHPPFDISKFREEGYDPALRD